MKKFFKILGKVLLYTFLGLLGIAFIGFVYYQAHFSLLSNQAKAKLVEKKVLQENGFSFRDLNGNGQLDIYEDSRQDVEARINDLLSQMTIEEKVGLLWHPPIGIGDEGQILEKPKISSFFFSSTSDLLLNKHITHYNLFVIPGPRHHAQWYNSLQKMAEQGRLGIPVTISTDPRHHIYEIPGINLLDSKFSRWPNPIGLAAIGDSLLVAEFGRIANQEYRALGIRTALHPQVDLATEPRWGRILSTFGEDAGLSAKLTAAYIYGFQGPELGPESVACMTKHWPGGGPQEDGWDAHFEYGANQVYPGNNFDYHLKPFEAAFEAGTAMVMPYYGIPVGQTSEDVGMGFNKEIIQGLLRDKYGFEGIVCTDWGIIGNKIFGIEMLGTPWGMQEFSEKERIEKVLHAGVDQFGGVTATGELLELIGEGRISESRIDQSARRILRAKFIMGLFDDPYIDEAKAEETISRSDFVAKGKEAQRKSIVLLKNEKNVLPLKKDLKIYIEGLDSGIAGQYATIVARPEEADYAILHLDAPYGKGLGSSFLESIFHQGDLDFKEPELSRILQITKQIPTIVCLFMDRPAVVPQIVDSSVGVLCEFGSDDDAVLDVIFGAFNPSAKLPFELPSSMEAVRNQQEDVPYDSRDPLFPFGYGLSYPVAIDSLGIELQ